MMHEAYAKHSEHYHIALSPPNTKWSAAVLGLLHVLHGNRRRKIKVVGPRLRFVPSPPELAVVSRLII